MREQMIYVARNALKATVIGRALGVIWVGDVPR